jgi:hypothetical protein
MEIPIAMVGKIRIAAMQIRANSPDELTIGTSGEAQSGMLD